MARLAFLETLERVNGAVLSAHLARRGFVQQEPGRWARGSRWGAWAGLTPRSWPARLEVRGREVALRIRASGQLLTRAEADFWEEEWRVLLLAAAGEPTDAGRVDRGLEVILVENGLLLVAVPVFAGVFGVAGAVLGSPAGAVLGALVPGGLVLGGGLLFLRQRPDYGR